MGDESADAFTHRLFAGDDKFLDVCGIRQVRAAAEFDRVGSPFFVRRIFQQIVYRCADAHHAHHRGILFAEDGTQAVDFKGLFLRGFLCVHRKFFRDRVGDQRLDFGDLFIAERFVM